MSADAISQDFAQVSDTWIHTQENLIPQQPWTARCCKLSNQGTQSLVEHWNREGVPFTRKFGTNPDFNLNLIIMGGIHMEQHTHPPQPRGMSWQGHPRPPYMWSKVCHVEGGTNSSQDWAHPTNSGADCTTDTLHLCLQGCTLFSRALEIGGQGIWSRINHLQEWANTGGTRYRLERSIGVSHRPLVVGIGRLQRWQTLHPTVTNCSGTVVIVRLDRSLPLVVIVQSVDVYPQFLPLGNSFHDGGTWDPVFCGLQGWPDVIYENSLMRHGTIPQPLIFTEICEQLLENALQTDSHSWQQQRT